MQPREERLAQQKAYRESPAGKAAKRRHAASPKGKSTLKAYRLRTPREVAARRAVMTEVRSGRMQRAKDLSCHCCHTSPAVNYHHASYEPEHKLDVIAVCTPCHHFIHN